VRQNSQPQHQLVPRRLRLRRLLVQLRDPIAQVTRFLLLRLSSASFLLAHERADLFGHALAPGLKPLDLAQQLASQLVALQHLVNAGPRPLPARRQALAHGIWPFANQFDVEHRRIIGRVFFGKAEGRNALRPDTERQTPWGLRPPRIIP